MWAVTFEKETKKVICDAYMRWNKEDQFQKDLVNDILDKLGSGKNFEIHF